MCDDLVMKHRARLVSSGGLFSGLRVAVVLNKTQKARVYSRIITAGGGVVLPVSSLLQLCQQWWADSQGTFSIIMTLIFTGRITVWTPWIS